MKDYTYADFENAAKQSGYYDRFSDYDRRLAAQYPEVGLTLLQYKLDYDAAETDEERKNANRRANVLRGFYGGYNGGADGSKYYTLGLDSEEPESFSTTALPTYSGSRYDSKRDGLLQALEGASFTYDKDSDPAWSAYAKQYRREGSRAAEDALGKASAATGGVPSSYAVTAASQAENVYASALADRLPELAEAAYGRWADDIERARKLADTYNTLSNRDYQRYRDERDDAEAEQKTAYALWLDDYERKAQRRSEREKAIAEALK